ncbi:carbohydrate esterase family 5 protein [Apiospora kogelbergensis]|uniref:carbohydrate esterase family 5 protein n=1 Tax=Apiospora kogelbergensis TaxID=1337665 RepID=UPI003131A0A4
MHANALFSLVSVLALSAHAAPRRRGDRRQARRRLQLLHHHQHARHGRDAGRVQRLRRHQPPADGRGARRQGLQHGLPGRREPELGPGHRRHRQQGRVHPADQPGRVLHPPGLLPGRAAATVNAMGRLTGASFDAVKGAFLIGNPMHKAGLACNIDVNGGATTKNVNGLSVFLGSIPQNWISKTMDVCAFGDGVCDTAHGVGINAVHLTYPTNAGSQKLGVEFAKKQLGV